MDWIKKNPAQLTLAIAAFLGISATAMLWMKVSDFDSNFSASRGGYVSSAKVEKLNTQTLDAARTSLDATLAWPAVKKDDPRLFISKPYVAIDGKLEQLRGKTFHPPVPNDWLEKHGLNVMSANVLNDDPSQKGFTVLEDWLGLDARAHLDMNGQPIIGPDGKPLPDDSTDPKDPNQHPPYHIKLELSKVDFVPFRLIMKSWDGPAKPAKPADITVQINTKDLKDRSQYVTVGNDILGTKFKVESFQHKEVPGPDGTTVDVSEATLMDKETQDKIVLPLKKEVNSPDSYATFRYKWVKPGGAKTAGFTKRRGYTFTLEPEKDKAYKVLKIRATEADIELPDGTKKTLTLTP